MKKIVAIIFTFCLVLVILWLFVFKNSSQIRKPLRESPKIVRKKIPTIPKVQKPASEQPISQKTETKPAVAFKIMISLQSADKTDEKPVSEDKTSKKPTSETKAVKKPALKEKADEKPAPEIKIAKKLSLKVKTAEKSTSEDIEMVYREREPFHPYSLRISSNRLKKTAQNHYNYYKSKGLSPFLVKLDLGKNGVWWNLHVGHYKTLYEVKKAKKVNKLHDALIKKMQYANLIGEFSSEKEMAIQYRPLEKLGYYPYIIRGEKNTILLFVGDFFMYKGAAERNQKRLKVEDIQSRFVKR